MKDYITVVGLDVHKDSIEVVLADTFGNREIRHYGKIGGDGKDYIQEFVNHKIRSIKIWHYWLLCGYMFSIPNMI